LQEYDLCGHPRRLGTEPQAGSSSIQIVSTLILSAPLYLMNCHLDSPSGTCPVHAILCRHGYLGRSALDGRTFWPPPRLSTTRREAEALHKGWGVCHWALIPKVENVSPSRREDVSLSRRRLHRSDGLRITRSKPSRAGKSTSLHILSSPEGLQKILQEGARE